MVLLSRWGMPAVAAFDDTIRLAAVEMVPFDAQLAAVAFEAFRRFGKGRGSPARLNIVDCAAYALARSRSMPLLFKGDDFAHTDIVSALGRS